MRDATGVVAGTEVDIETADGVIVIRRSSMADGIPSGQHVRDAIADGLASGHGRGGHSRCRLRAVRM